MALRNIEKEISIDIDGSSFSPYLKELDKELDSNSDRSIALVCCSVLEELLKEKIKTCLVSDNQTDKLFEANGPFGSAINRTRIAYYMGLITENQFKNLKYMQRVRNIFAHQILDVSFESNKIKNICSNMEIPFNMYTPRHIPYKKTIKEKRNGEETEQDVYVDVNPYDTPRSTKERYLIMFRYLYDVLRPFDHNIITPAEELLPHKRIQKMIDYYKNQINSLKEDNQDSESEEKISELERFLENNEETFNRVQKVLKNNYNKIN